MTVSLCSGVLSLYVISEIIYIISGNMYCSTIVS